jgi:hypothetical protein
MLWLKRNLSLAISGAVALLLGGGVCLFLLQSVAKNRSVEEELQGMKSQLDKYYRQNPFPHQTNINTAKKELQRVTKAVSESKKFFVPVPSQNVTGMAFKTLLDKTIYELTQTAQRSSITLPQNPYYFSFQNQKTTLTLNPGSFPAITEQLAEVEQICRVLFSARIHGLTSLKRTPLTSDDQGTDDYNEDFQIQSNAVTGAIISPYEVSFTGFSSELASVLEQFTRSEQGILIRAIKVERYEEPDQRRRRGGPPPPPPPLRAAPRRRPAQESQTLLNEERFQTTLLLAVVKPTR